ADSQASCLGTQSIDGGPEEPRFSICTGLVADHAAYCATPRVWRAENFRGTREHFGRGRYIGFSRPRPQRPAIGTARNLGLWAAKSLPTLARARFCRAAFCQRACRTLLLVGHGSPRETKSRRQSVAKRRNRERLNASHRHASREAVAVAEVDIAAV